MKTQNKYVGRIQDIILRGDTKSLEYVGLTEKEAVQLAKFRQGKNNPGEGWLHELEMYSGKTLSGVVGSLVKKGLILSNANYIEPGMPPVYWITVTRNGQEAIAGMINEAEIQRYENAYLTLD